MKKFVTTIPAPLNPREKGSHGGVISDPMRRENTSHLSRDLSEVFKAVIRTLVTPGRSINKQKELACELGAVIAKDE
jgi:hypothetical protein